MISISTELRRLWNMCMKLFHKHRYDILGAEEIKVGLTGGRHTGFMILKCKCGKKVVFPEDNFKIAQQEGTEETIKFIASLGVRINVRKNDR